jgi:CHAT domain-containing protein
MNRKTATLWAWISLFWLCSSPLISQQPAQPAHRLLEQGRPKEALVALSGSHFPEEIYPEILFLRGRCYQMLMRNDSAIFFLKMAAEKESDENFRNRVKRFLAASLPYPDACREMEEQLTLLQSGQIKESYEMAEALSLLGIIHTRNGKYDLAKPHLLRSIEIFRAIGEGARSQSGITYRTLGFLFWKNSEYETAIKYNQSAEQIFLETGGVENYNLWPLYLNWSGCCNDMGAPEKAITYGQKGLAYLITHFPKHQNLPNFYNNLGNAAKVIRDFPAAIAYFREGIALQPRNGRFYNNLGDVYSAGGDTANARTSFLKAIELLMENEETNAENLARPYHNLAILARRQGQFSAALTSEEKSLYYRKKAHAAKPHLDVARTCTGIGESWAGLGNYEKAIAWFDSALHIHQSVLPKGQHPEIATAWLGKARTFAATGDFDKQATALDSALNASGYAGDGTSPILSTIGLVEALSEKGSFHLNRGKKTGREEDLKTATRLFDAAIGNLSLHRRIIRDEDIRSSLSGNYFSLFEHAMSAASLLFSMDSAMAIEAALRFTEQGKYLALLESIKSEGALHFSNLPDSLLEKERRLGGMLTVSRQKLSESMDSEAAEKNRAFYLQAKLEYDLFVKNLEDNFPDYYRLKYEGNTPSLDSLRTHLLRPEQTLVEYFAGDHFIFVLIINRHQFYLKEIKLDFALEEWIRRLRTCIVEERSTGSVELAEIASSLYQKLVQPLGDITGEELLIVPDGILSYLPFELLLTEKPANPLNFKSHRYFFKKYNISYCYSTALLREMVNRRHHHEPRGSLLALAPFFQGDTTALAPVFAGSDLLRKDFKPLPYSGEEVFGIAKITKGNALFGAQANKAIFKNMAGNYRILHLSTHGQADDRTGDFSFLAFAPEADSLENGLLYLREIYDFELNADLAVLSACETGVGKLLKGEGVASLARAFTYAGTKSIVTSLWSVSDATTKDLMLSFYRYLEKGLRKDSALRQAKLDYISQSNNLGAHPFYWAGFVPVGDMNSVRF